MEEKYNTENNAPEVSAETDAQEPEKKLRKRVGLIESLKGLGQKIIETFRDYPVAMISIVLAALLGAVLVDWDNHDTEIYLQRMIGFFLILAVHALFLEEWFPKQAKIRYPGYAVSALISAAYIYVLSYQEETFLGMDMEVLGSNLAKVLCVHGTILVCLSIHHMFKRLEENFEVYAARAFLELVKSTVIYGLFALGLAIIIWIFNELLFDTDEFLSQVELFLAGGIYVPMCIKAISGKNEEPGKFARVCFLYVLQPMLLLAFAIIYLYILKIFITNDVPSNHIFNILAFLFAIGMPVWTVVHGMEQKKSFLQRAVFYVPYVFIPFVLLQCWSMGIRIADYGLTSSRYFAIVLVFCEVVYFALYFWHHKGRKSAIADILYVLIAVSFFAILCPGVNFEDAVIHSQLGRLTKLLESDAPDAGVVKSAYRVINYSGYKGKNILKEKLTADQIAKIEAMDEYGDIIDHNIYIYGSVRFTDVDVSAYRNIREFQYGALNDDGTVALDIFNKDNRAEQITVDMSGYFDYIMENFKEDYDRDYELEDYCVISIDENRDLYMTYFSMSYNEVTKEVKSLSVSGYVLEK